MHKRLAALLLMAGTAYGQFLPAGPCYTITPVGGLVPCASETTSILSKIEHILANITLSAQLAQQVDMLANLVRNSKRNGTSFGNVAAELQTLNNIVHYGQALSYSVANVDKQWNIQYPGVGVLTTMPQGTYGQRYGQWARTANDSVIGAMLAANAAAQMRQGSVSGILAGIRTLSVAAQGWMHMHEVQAMGLDLQNSNMYQLQQGQAAQLQATSAMAGYQLQKDSENIAATQRFFTVAKPVSDGYVPGMVPTMGP